MTKDGRRSDPVKLPVRRRQGTPPPEGRKLSEIIKEFAMRLLKNPRAIPSPPAAVAALTLAGAAWNSAIGDKGTSDLHRKLVEQIDWNGAIPWAELRSANTDQLIAELAEYKRRQYPADLRRVVATEMTPEGNVRVHWTEPEKVVTAAFASANGKAAGIQARRGHPIADKLIKKMQREAHETVVDLQAVIAGRKNAEELQKTVATREALADLHPRCTCTLRTRSR